MERNIAVSKNYLNKQMDKKMINKKGQMKEGNMFMISSISASLKVD
jgi:hypothetical protein